LHDASWKVHEIEDANNCDDADWSAAAATTDDQMGWCSPGAAALDALHGATGLPWWAAIPAVSLAVKSALLPLSLRQAKIVRTNMALWRESFELEQQLTAKRAQQQQQQQQQQKHIELDAAKHTLERLAAMHSRLVTFHELRRRCNVPHPAWLLGNGLMQSSVLVYGAVCIRRMAAADWPGFASEGTLWFTDLTQAAVVLGSGASSVALPMGSIGLVLPAVGTCMTLCSVYLGFKASGEPRASMRHHPCLGLFPPLT
jgi:membrane protein insertase Oxa1/YidC/SpoIIIJ